MTGPVLTVADVLGDEQVDWPITIGVALPIPEPFLAELGAYRERFGDPLAHAIVAHITLVPPMTVPDPTRLGQVLAHLGQVAFQLAPFPLVLAGAGTFRPVSPVVFVPIGGPLKTAPVLTTTSPLLISTPKRSMPRGAGPAFFSPTWLYCDP